MNYEEIIEKIEDILEDGKPSFGGGGKVKIDGDAITECLKELSSSIPTEIIQARKIVAERREILQAAQETASKIVSDAQVKADKMTEEHEITIAAKDAAYKIMAEANEQASSIVSEANAEAEEREASARRWSYELRMQASEFAKNLMGECDEYLTRNIDFFTQSKENANQALANLQNVSLKISETDR